MYRFGHKKKTNTTATGGGPPPEDLTSAEGLALSCNWGCSVIKGTEGGNSSDFIPQGAWEQYVQGIAFNECQFLSSNDW